MTWCLYVVILQPKYQQVPNQSTEPSRTDEVAVFLITFYSDQFSVFRWKYVISSSAQKLLSLPKQKMQQNVSCFLRPIKN